MILNMAIKFSREMLDGIVKCGDKVILLSWPACLFSLRSMSLNWFLSLKGTHTNTHSDCQTHLQGCSPCQVSVIHIGDVGVCLGNEHKCWPQGHLSLCPTLNSMSALRALQPSLALWSCKGLMYAFVWGHYEVLWQCPISKHTCLFLP